ncbi:hypothetical protein D3C87_1830690 [compost metagenome]
MLNNCHHTPWSTSLPGISGLNTVGSCEMPAITCPRGADGGVVVADVVCAQTGAAIKVPAVADSFRKSRLEILRWIMASVSPLWFACLSLPESGGSQRGAVGRQRLWRQATRL